MEKKYTEKDIQELEDFLDKEDVFTPTVSYLNTSSIDNFLKDEIIFTPLIGRVRREEKDTKEYLEKKEYIFDKIDNYDFTNELKIKVENIKNNINKDKFYDFKDKYKSLYTNDIIRYAMLIKDDNKEYTKDIGKFLFKNGIILFNEHYPENANDDFKRLDGFSCFYNRYPIIVIYDIHDKRRMLFTILHELYHLMYDENEKYADKFAGSALLTVNNVKEEFKEYNIFKIENDIGYENIIRRLCLNNYISVTAATKTLINYNILIKKEEDYRSQFEDIRKEVEKEAKNKFNKDIIINSIYDIIKK
ncbi:hypothetical protein [uncultured Brachyspira sp.]|uniref:ImmA/IrrE family metallo-endopeptidase n=1 Tax=uncultured Brachyspira sp. TaxID=221953 RepID=UPI0026234715|nr:hypothetical protein [uncultured Brachyspira sp.]